MQANRRRDTTPELAVRRLLHARGYRYRVDFAPLPGLRRRADIVFTKARVSVFIDGCFWHGCPDHGRSGFAHNADYWPGKIAGNIARDANTNSRLTAAGWTVLRFWEHEPASAIVARIEEIIGRRASSTGVTGSDLPLRSSP